MSARPSAASGSPACSGAMKAGVPTTAGTEAGGSPAALATEAGAFASSGLAALAVSLTSSALASDGVISRPRSSTLTSPAGSIRRFAGFTSRCQSPCRCAALSPRAAWRIITAARPGSIFGDACKTSSSDGPPTHSTAA